jgi:hypothetical protein
VGGSTQAAGESCVIGEPGSGGLFPDTCDCCSSSFVRPYPSLEDCAEGPRFVGLQQAHDEGVSIRARSHEC